MIPRTMSQAGWREIEKGEYESLFNSPGHINGDIECTNIENTCSSKEGNKCKMTCAKCVFQFISA